MKRTREEAIQYLVEHNIAVHEYSIKSAMGEVKDSHYLSEAFQVQDRWYSQNKEY